jgi:TusA-related sulfurtransferase
MIIEMDDILFNNFNFDVDMFLDRNWIVYMHISPSGKKYIGITSRTTKERWGMNGCKYHSTPRFYNAIQKYGWDNIEHNILYTGLSKGDAERTEINLITKYKTIDREFGYNIATGGFASTHSKETREKMSEVKKGKILTVETKQKISNANMGKIPWNKGKTGIFSEETLKRMSESRKGKTHFEDAKNKIGDAQRGKVVSIETRNKLSEAHKGRKHSEDTKNKIGDVHRGKVVSIETRNKMSESAKRRWVEKKAQQSNTTQLSLPFNERSSILPDISVSIHLENEQL